MLFTPKQLTAYLQLSTLDTPEAPTPQAIDPDTYTVLHQVVVGWLTGATGLSPLPGSTDAAEDLPPAALAAWAIELAAIAFHRPSSAASDSSGATSMSWNEQRRTAILNSAARWAQSLDTPADAVPAAQASFPNAPRWPSDLGASQRSRSRRWVLND